MGLLRLLGIEKYLKKVKNYVDEQDTIVNQNIATKINQFTDNIFSPAVGGLHERVSVLEEKPTPEPDWNAPQEKAGYIKNRTHYIYTDGPTLGDYNYTLVGNEYVTEIWVGQRMLLAWEDYSTMVDNLIEWQEKECLDGESVTIIVDGEPVHISIYDGYATVKANAYTIENDKLKAVHYIGDEDESNLIVRLSEVFMPKTIASKKYVDEKMASIPQGGSLIAMYTKDLPFIEIDANNFANGVYSFAQLGLTDEHVDKCIIALLLKSNDEMTYGFQMVNCGSLSEIRREINDGFLILYYSGNEGDATVRFDFYWKTMNISNDWE